MTTRAVTAPTTVSTVSTFATQLIHPQSAGFDTPFPYTLEDVYMPNADRVVAAIQKATSF